MRPGPRLEPAPLIPAIALLVAACMAGAPAQSGDPAPAQPAAVPSAEAEPAATAPAVVSGARDAWLVVGHPGEDGVRVKLASSGEEIIRLPLGVPDATWGRVLTVTTKRPNSLIEDLVVQPGFGGPLRTDRGRRGGCPRSDSIRRRPACRRTARPSCSSRTSPTVGPRGP